MVLSQLTYELDFDFMRYLFDRKYGVIQFLNEVLQAFSGKIFQYALILCSNIAEVNYSRDLLKETNFIARIRDWFKDMSMIKQYNIEILLEMMRALKAYSCKKLSTIEIDICLDIIKIWIDQQDYGEVLDEEILAEALILIAEITNETDISQEALDKGITFRLIWLLRHEEKSPEFKVVYNCLMALGGLSSTQKIEPIDEMITEGIFDNLMFVADTEDPESLEKIYWIWANIAASSQNWASTFFLSDIFISIIDGLWEGRFEQHLEVVKEAIFWVVNTFTYLDDENRMRLILKMIDDEDEYHKNPINKLFEALVEGLKNNLTNDITIHILKMIKDIFEFSDTHTPVDYKGDFKKDVHDNFVFSGGPETIEDFTNNESVEVNKLAYEIATKWLIEERDQVFDFAFADSSDIKF